MNSWRLAIVAMVIWMSVILGGTYLITGFKDDPRTNELDGHAGTLAGLGVIIPFIAIILGKKKPPDKDT